MNKIEEMVVEPQNTGPDLWKMFWRWKWLLVCGLVVGAGLGALYGSRQKPVYESSARMLVTRQRANSPIGGQLAYEMAMMYQQAALSTQAAIIRSPVIVQEAVKGAAAPVDEDLQKIVASLDRELGRTSDEESTEELTQTPRLDTLDSLKGRDAVSAILGGLRAEPSSQSGDLLELGYRGPDPADCQVILSAVINSYQTHLRGARDSNTRQTAKLIADAKDELAEQIRIHKEDLNKFRTTHGHLLYRDEAGQNVHHQRMSSIESQRTDLAIQMSDFDSQLKAIDLAVNDNRVREAMIMLTNRDLDLRTPAQVQRDSIAAQMLPLMLEELRLTDRYGADHPDVVSLKKRMRLSQEVLEEVQASIPEDLDIVDPKEQLAVHVGVLKQRVSALQLQDERLQTMFKQEEDAAKALASLEAQEDLLQGEIANLEELHTVVAKKLGEINLADDLGGYEATPISPPGFGYQVEPNLNRIMMTSVMLGLLGAFGLAYLIEMADKSFRNAEDIQRTMGVPLVGHIPVIEGRKIAAAAAGSSLDPMLVTVHKPGSPLSEAYRAVRTALYFSTRGQGHQVVQITSPTPGDGKTTLAANLAVSIAQSNKSVLLLDADCRRPRIHKIFDLHRSVGLSTAIGHDVELDDVIQTCQVENLSIMTAGPATDNPSELMTSPRFAELIGLLREKFQFVIIDSPPMLAVTDSSAVAARVDGVLLTMRITKQSRGTALRSAELLDSLNANVLGLVVNGVGRKQGYGYGSGSYSGYGYAYGSAYGYGYGAYGENGAGKYYQPDESDEPVRRA